MLRIDPKDIPLAKLHGYLLGAVAPRPIAFASTVNQDGIPNLAPFSFFNMFSVNPPVGVFSPSRRGKDGTSKHTYENAKSSKEVVINMVTYDMVQQMSLASSDYPEGVSEFEKAGFTPIESEMVKPFRVKESPIQMECKVNDIIELGQEGGAGNMIIFEIVLMHVSEDILDDNGSIDTNKIDLVGRMGGNQYVRASGDAIFEVIKPGMTTGIGVDQIPESIRNSTILTGNDLGKLGSVEELPDDASVNEYKEKELKEIFNADPEDLNKKLQNKAQALLAESKIPEAWKTLLATR